MRRRAVALLFAGVLLFSLTSTEASLARTAGVTLPGKIQTVFVIVMENRSWPSVTGSPLAPYINGTLLPIGAHAERYYKPHGYSSSLPIYLWMEVGRSVGIWADGPPTAKSVSTTDHLVTRLKNLGITWKGYFGGMVPPHVRWTTHSLIRSATIRSSTLMALLTTSIPIRRTASRTSGPLRSWPQTSRKALWHSTTSL